MQLDAKQIHTLFESLNRELQKQDLKGELNLVGGAVMCLVFNARSSTQDVDAYFAPSSLIRQAAVRVALDQHLSANWLNDGVKGFLSPHGDYSNYLELSHLKVLTATAEYMLAMKCLSCRIGAEFHDIEDIRYLLRHLGLESLEQARAILERYYPLGLFPQKSQYILEELLQAAESV